MVVSEIESLIVYEQAISSCCTVSSYRQAMLIFSPTILQVVQIFQGEVGTTDVQVMLPGYLWLYADGTFGVLFDSWDHIE